MTVSTWDPAPSDAPYIKITTFEVNEEPYIRAQVFLRGEMVGEGDCPNTGLYKKEAIAEKTAISQALFQFGKRFDELASQKVIRG